jgi:hypothetical protein
MSSLRQYRLWLCAFAIGVFPAVAFAQLSAIPYAAEDYEHNSNIFYLPSSGPAPLGSSGPTFGDTTLRSRAGIDATYLWDRQRFYASGEGRHFDYDHFSYLNHNEVLLNGGLDWKLGRLLDGIVDYRHERRMVQFTDLLDSTQFILETENVVSASANVQVTPEWRLENRARERTLDSPRPGAPNLSLREDSIHEAVRYLGVADLSAGLDMEYLDGKFRDDPAATTPQYHQTTVQLTGNYLVSGLTDINGALGYTSRSDPTGNGTSGLTGALGYKRNLTPKTSINLQLARAVNSYVSTAGSEIDTSASVNASWLATYKLTVKAGYAWTHSKYPQFGGNSRADNIQLVNLEMSYEVLRWLSVRPYFRYQTRSSDLANFGFNSTIYGVEVQAKVFQRK